MKENYTARIDTKIKGGLLKQAEQLGMGNPELAAELLSLDLEIVRSLEVAFMTMETPAYLMDNRWHVVKANFAATALFDFPSGEVDISPEELIDIFGRALTPECVKAETDHFEKFMNKKSPPPMDESLTELIAPNTRYGTVKLFRRGIRISQDRWVVFWNIRSIARAGDFEKDWKIRLDSWIAGVTFNEKTQYKKP